MKKEEEVSKFLSLFRSSKNNERSYRQHCEEVVYPKGPQFPKGRESGLSVGQFHRAVNNDISEGMVGYRNFGSPLDWGNDRTRRWTALSLSPSPPDLSLLSPSLLAFTYTNWSISRLIRFNRQNCLFNIEYFCFHGKNNRIVKLTAGNDIIFNRTYGIFVKIVERFNEYFIKNIFRDLYISYIYIYTFSSHILPYSRTD